MEDKRTQIALEELLGPGETLTWWARGSSASALGPYLPSLGWAAVSVGAFIGYNAYSKWQSNLRLQESYRGLARTGYAPVPTSLPSPMTDVFFFGGLFLLFALLIISVVWAAARRRVYALTNRRLIVIEGVLRSYAPEQIGEVTAAERKEGRGDVLISLLDPEAVSQVSMGSDLFQITRENRRGRIGLYGIPEPAAAAEKVQSLARPESVPQEEIHADQ